MKHKMFCLFLMIFLLIPGCSAKETCPACGRECDKLVECPICGIRVCDFCCDDDYYIDHLINYGKIEQYMDDYGYVVFDDLSLAYELYMYGFNTGYQKGISGIHDEEVEEAKSYDYNYLQEEYGKYGW